MSHPALALLSSRPDLFSRQGSIVVSYRAHNGRRLGPYHRLAWRENGRQHSLYLGLASDLVQKVRDALTRLQEPKKLARLYNSMRRSATAGLRAAKAQFNLRLRSLGLHLKGFELRGLRVYHLPRPRLPHLPSLPNLDRVLPSLPRVALPRPSSSLHSSPFTLHSSPSTLPSSPDPVIQEILRKKHEHDHPDLSRFLDRGDPAPSRAPRRPAAALDRKNHAPVDQNSSPLLPRLASILADLIRLGPSSPAQPPP